MHLEKNPNHLTQYIVNEDYSQLTFLGGNFVVCHQGPWTPKQQSVQIEKINTLSNQELEYH